MRVTVDHRPGSSDNIDAGMDVQPVDLTREQRGQSVNLVGTLAYLSTSEDPTPQRLFQALYPYSILNARAART